MIVWDRDKGVAGLDAQPAGRNRGSLSVLWSAGLIANRRDLLPQSSANGVSDVDLLLDLFSSQGTAAASRIAGTFSWVLWDGRRERLILARDRLGTQGLYFRLDGDQVLFSPRAEELVVTLPRPWRLNERAVVGQIQGTAPPPTETLFDGIAAVAPGTLVILLRGGIETRRYWQLAPQPLLQLGSDAAYAEALLEVLFAVVAQYSVGGPVAVTLSSGLDSTAVAAALAEARPPGTVTALSWVAPELPEADESRGIAATCSRLGLELVPIRADQHWPLKGDHELRPPLAGPEITIYSALWQATYTAAVQNGIAVLFSGLSGDHLFGGNVFAYPDLLLTGRWLRLARELWAHVPRSQLSPTQLLRRMVLGPIARTYLPLRRFESALPVPWLAERYHDLARRRDPQPSRALLPSRRERLKLLADPLLPRALEEHTAAAAEHGLDFRHPLVDHRLIEFALRLPGSQSFAAGERKGILRRALRDRLPPEVVDRRDKIYPSAIAWRGLREREVDKVLHLMTDMRASAMGFVDEKRLRDHYASFLRGETQVGTFWHTLTLEAWLRRHLG